MKEIFKNLIKDFIRREIKVKTRDYSIPTDTQKIVSLVGIRRCGKTYLLFQLINKLREKVPRENIIYINFEDDRLSGLKLNDLDNLINGYYELYPQKRNEKIYLFLDEIQEVNEWEKFVRRIYDNYNINLFVTGSSSKLTSKEIASSLRGRTISYEVFPLSFKEFLSFKEIEIDLYSSESRFYIKNAFYEYTNFGGFPEVALEKDEEVKRRILSDYTALIIYKDVAERYELKNLNLLKFIVRNSFKNPSTLMSYNKLYNDLKSMGYQLSKETLINYFGYLEDIYALFLIPVYRWSVKEQVRNPKKIFIADNGFKTIHSLELENDYSKLYENLVFTNLRRKYKEIFYLLEDKEIDFYLPERKLVINVCYELSFPETLKRELNSLEYWLKKLGLKEAFIITNDDEKELNLGGLKINIIPIWKWLTEFEI
ncbi:MAG: ATP-binding protein [Brevinematia bacterium]